MAQCRAHQGGTGIPESAQWLNEDMPGKSLCGNAHHASTAVGLSPWHMFHRKNYMKAAHKNIFRKRVPGSLAHKQNQKGTGVAVNTHHGINHSLIGKSNLSGGLQYCHHHRKPSFRPPRKTKPTTAAIKSCCGRDFSGVLRVGFLFWFFSLSPHQ
jgi:hypothetical protein